MRKLLFITIIVLLLTSMQAFAYTQLCLSDGQGTPVDDPVYVCEHSQCIVCVTESGYPTLPQRCSDVDGCNFLNDSNADFTPPVMNISSPLNGETYNEASIALTIVTNELAKYYIRDNNDNRGYSKIADLKKFYDRDRRWDEGMNNYTIKATDARGNSVEQELIFYVDTKDPKIKDYLPEDDDYVGTNTLFWVEYDEENLQHIYLNYGPNAENQVELLGCPSGKGMECSTSIDLSAYNGQDIQFYFSVLDSINQDVSDTETLHVDTQAPTITIISALNTDFGDRRVDFVIDLDEVVDELTYINWGDKRPKEKRLCRNCDSYDRPKTFKDGDHMITFYATDYAGNKDEVTVDFSVDSKGPRVKKVDPKSRKYANGDFWIQYDELNLQSMMLTIIDQNGVSTEYNVEGCPSGEKVECVASVDVSSYEDQLISYYFTLSDLFASTTSRLQKEIKVDTIAPTIINLTPAQGQVFNDDEVELFVEISEEVEIMYTLDDERERRLCSRCTEKDKTLRIRDLGSHTLLVTATDPAGNSVSATRDIDLV